MGAMSHVALLIGPDPEARRLMMLACELEGIQTRELTSPSEFDHLLLRAHVAVVDIADDGDVVWEWARRVIGRKKNLPGLRTVILLPRGFNAKTYPDGCHAADLYIKKPYELFGTVRKIQGVMDAVMAPVRSVSGKKKASPGKVKKALRKRSPASARGRRVTGKTIKRRV